MAAETAHVAHEPRTQDYAVGRVPRRFTADEYERMGELGILDEDERIELIDGEIIEMSPIGVRHARCVSNLTELLVVQLISLNANQRYQVWSQNPIRLSGRTRPQPDVAFVRRRHSANLPTAKETLLVIEVADSSLDYDRNEKFPRYAAAGIAEAWLVDINVGIIERHTEPGAEGYGIVTPFRVGEVITSVVLPGLAVPVAEVFA